MAILRRGSFVGPMPWGGCVPEIWGATIHELTRAFAVQSTLPPRPIHAFAPIFCPYKERTGRVWGLTRAGGVMKAVRVVSLLPSATEIASCIIQAQGTQPTVQLVGKRCVPGCHVWINLSRK